MSRLKRLLQVATPSTCNTQQNSVQPCKAVAQHTHTAQQVLLHVARPSPGNTQQAVLEERVAVNSDRLQWPNIPTTSPTIAPEQRDQLGAEVATKAELRRLVPLVTSHLDYFKTERERAEALENALKHSDLALPFWRGKAKQLGLQ